MNIFEGKYFLIKYLGLFLGIIVTFLQPKFFNTFFTVDEFAYLLLLFGISNYLLLFDGGLSKSIYPSIRKKFIDNISLNDEVIDLFSVFNLIGLISFIVFCFAALFFHQLYITNFKILFILLFSFFMSVNVLISFYKNILSAIDEYIFFEKIDVSRKIINILMILLLYIDHSFVSSILFGFLSLLVLYVSLLYKVCFKINISFFKIFSIKYDAIKRVVKKYYTDSKDSLIFTINEILIYNGGYIIFPFFLNSYEIIIYGLWVRLFTGISMLFRAITDISIHNITRNYFEGNNYEVIKNLKIITSLNFIIIFCSFLIYFLYQDNLFFLWLNNDYFFPKLTNAALWIIIIANALQHIAGTFLISVGGNFQYIKKLSSIIMITIMTSNIILGYIYNNINIILLFLSIFYALGSLVYMLKLIKHNESNVKI